MKEILYNMQGIFAKTNSTRRSGIVSDLYVLEYLGHANDRENIKRDISNLLFDFKSSVKAAKI
jgi:hypothetical protein